MNSFKQWQLNGARNIELVERPFPSASDEEARLAIEYATTCGTDLKAFQAGGHARMLTPPCPFGHEMVGTLEDVGPNFDTGLAQGSRVIVSNSSPCLRCRPCQLGRENLCTDQRYINGAFGEQLLLPARFARSVHSCPDGLAPELACLAEPLACALHCIEELGPSLDRFTDDTCARAIVMGAGPLGLLLIALLREHGVETVSVDPNPERLRLAIKVGARSSVLYHRVLDDLHDHRERYDFSLDASGTIQGWRNATSCVAPGGEVVLFGGIPGGGDLPIDSHRIHYGEILVRGLYHHRPALFPKALAWLVENQTIARLLVSTMRPLEQLPEALDDMENRRAFKVALRITDR